MDAAKYAPHRLSSSSGSDGDQAPDNDAYNQQVAVSVLPPSRRSSLATRRNSAVESTPSTSTRSAPPPHLSASPAGTRAPAPAAPRDDAPPPLPPLPLSPTAALTFVRYADAESPTAGHDGARGATETGPRHPPRAGPPHALNGSAAWATPSAAPTQAPPAALEFGSPSEHSKFPAAGAERDTHHVVPPSLLRYRFGDAAAQEQQHHAAHLAARAADPLYASWTSSSTSRTPSTTPQTHVVAEAPLVEDAAAAVPPPPPSRLLSSPLRNSEGAPHQTDAQTPPLSSRLQAPPVRFAARVEVLEGTAGATAARAGDAAGGKVSGGGDQVGLSGAEGPDFSPRRSGSASPVGRGRAQGHSSAADGDDDIVVAPIPELLSPDELQLERLKSYDRVVQHRHPHPNHNDGEGACVTPASSAGGDHANEDVLEEGVSTLDFLRDTTQTLLPDALNNMFATTTNFLWSATEAVVNAVPQPLRRAAGRAGDGIASAADFTGSVLSGMQTYATRTVPDKVLSPKWKYLIFVDAINVLKCSWNVNILVAPYILRMGGLVGGILLMILMQLLCCYYTEVFFIAKHQLRRAEHVIMYGDVPRMTFGYWYPTFQLWYDGVALVATVAYAALNLQALLPHMRITGGTAKALSFIVPPLFSLPFVLMKRARSQPPLLTVASLLIFISLVMMCTVFPYGNVVRATIKTIQQEDTTIAVLHLFPESVAEFFVAVSISVYMFTPLRTAVPVERTMTPRRYVKLLRVCSAISTAVHIAFAVCVLVSYGSLTCSVLPSSFSDNHASVEVAVMSLLFFAFLLYIPLSLFEVGELADRRLLGWRTIPAYGEAGPNLLRIIFLAVSALIAYEVPYYGLLLAFCGSFGYAAVAIIIPAALDYVRRERQQLLRGRTLRLLDYVVSFGGVALGLVIFGVGIVLTIYQTWLVTQAGYEYAC